MGGGTVLDLGVYVIQFAQFVTRQPPKSIEATGVLNAEGIDSEVHAKLTYSDSLVANVTTSALKQLSNSAVIKGTKGQITVKTAIDSIFILRVRFSGNLLKRRKPFNSTFNQLVRFVQ